MNLVKLAVRNVKKSFKDYFIYFVTLMFSVCLFYTFNSFSTQQEILQITASQESIFQFIGQLLHVLSVFVALVLAFLIVYANNFLIRRRKQEFGIYMLLGMPKKYISRILVYETLSVGILSLFSGLLLGIGATYLMSYFSASMLHSTMHFQFMFSMNSFIITILSFGIIFLFVMLLNIRIMKKVTLLELIYSNKKSERLKITSPLLSFIFFIISIMMIGFAYYMATLSLQSFAVMLVPIMLIGGIGTLLFFYSLSGFLLTLISKNKRFYYHHVNMVVLRSIHAKISSNAKTMGIVCLMLLLSVGALACGFSLQTSLNSQLKHATPYDYSFQQNVPIPQDDIKTILNIQKDTTWSSVRVYEDDAHISSIKNQLPKVDSGILYDDAIIQYIPLSDFNHAMTMQQRKRVTLKDNEAFIVYGNDKIANALPYDGEITLPIASSSFQIRPIYQDSVALETSATPEIMFAFVVNDIYLEHKLPAFTLWNVNTSNIETYNEQVKQRYNAYIQAHQLDNAYYFSQTRNEVEQNVLSFAMMFIYIGMYLGIVFLISSAAILALQQLSSGEDQKRDYQILANIGATTAMMKHSIGMQIAIYFMLPMTVALIHAYVGVGVISEALSILFNLDNMWQSNLICGIILLLIYGFYFLLTYFGCLKTLHMPILQHSQNQNEKHII